MIWRVRRFCDQRDDDSMKSTGIAGVKWVAFLMQAFARCQRPQTFSQTELKDSRSEF